MKHIKETEAIGRVSKGTTLERVLLYCPLNIPRVKDAGKQKKTYLVLLRSSARVVLRELVMWWNVRVFRACWITSNFCLVIRLWQRMVCRGVVSVVMQPSVPLWNKTRANHTLHHINQSASHWPSHCQPGSKRLRTSGVTLRLSGFWFSQYLSNNNNAHTRGVSTTKRNAPEHAMTKQ